MLALAHHTLAARNVTLAALLPAVRRLGFRQLALTQGDVIPKAGPAAQAMVETGVKIVSLRAGALDARLGAGRTPCSELGSLDDARRDRALSAVDDHIAFAKNLSIPMLIIDGGRAEVPGVDERVRHLEGLVSRGEAAGELIEEIGLLCAKKADAHLDRFARSLHRITRTHAPMRFALLPATAPHELLRTSALEAVLADVRSENLGVWFDVGRQRTGERLGAESSTHVLATLAARAVGLDLHDASGLRDQLVPGEGEVDWKMISEHAPRAAQRVLSLGAGADAQALQQAVHVLEGLHLA